MWITPNNSCFHTHFTIAIEISWGAFCEPRVHKASLLTWLLNKLALGVKFAIQIYDELTNMTNIWRSTQLTQEDFIDLTEVLYPVIHASNHVRCQCKRHGVGFLWLLLLKPKTGEDKWCELGIKASLITWVGGWGVFVLTQYFIRYVLPSAAINRMVTISHSRHYMILAQHVDIHNGWRL